jgi:hypothetical protein
MKGRRNPAKGPLLTFGLMIGSVLVVVAISRYFDTQPKTTATPQSVQASANGGSTSSSR